MAATRGRTARLALPGKGTGAVVLAAGRSSRMGRSKPLAELDGRTLLDRALGALRSAGVRPIVVVLGDRADEVRRGADLRGTTVVVNPVYRDGMSTSLRAGIAAMPGDVHRVLVVLGDQPFVSPATLRALATRAEAGDGSIFRPTFRGVWGNPVLFDVRLAPELDGVEGDVGCRALFPRHASEIREVEVDDPGILVDIDTPEELDRIAAALRAGRPSRPVLEELVAPRVALHASPREHPLPRRLALGPDVDAIAATMRSEGVPFALATVVRSVRPTSGRPGYKALIRPDGSHVGWVGGACTEHLLISESLAALREGTPRLLRVAPDVSAEGPVAEGVVERPMVCQSGGTVEIFIEPNRPKPNLLIVGDSPLAASLATMGPVLGFRTILVAPGAEPHDLPEVDVFVRELDGIAPHLTPTTYAVVASMGKYDEPALAKVARGPIAFVGLVASRKRASSVFAAVRQDGVTAEELARVRAPVGLDIAASTPEEIALSVLAEIVKVRRTSPPAEAEPAPTRSPKAAAAIAVDPVCAMEVETSTPLRHVHAGTTYYFCSDGCRRRFARSPKRFLAA